MEQVATVEQAAPQGSAAPASTDSAPDFGAAYKAHVFKTRTSTPATQPGASSGDAETSAADEQPASAAPPPAGAAPDTDGTGTPEDTSPDTTAAEAGAQKLSRSQRKALKATQDQPAVSEGDGPATDDHPVVRAVDERLSKLEALLTPAPAPSEDEQAYATTYAKTFGDDAEYFRRAQLAVSRSADLSLDEQDELERWAGNRYAAELKDVQWKRNLSVAALSAAEAAGLDPQTIVSAPSPAAIFAAFVERGKALAAADADARVVAADARAKKLEDANRLLADEAEALRDQLPAGARRYVAGAVSAVPSASGPPIDRQKASARQLLAAGLNAQIRAGTARRGQAGYARPG